MTSTKRRFFLAGGLSVAIAIVLGIMLSMSALAAPSLVTGTLEVTDSDDDPLTTISSDADVDDEERTVTVSVEDSDLNALTSVGDEDDDDSPSVILTVGSAGVTAASNGTLNILLSAAAGAARVIETEIDDDIMVTIRDSEGTDDPDAVLPIFGDVTIDYTNSVNISRSDISVDVVRNRTTGLIRFDINGDLQNGDEIHLDFQTSDDEATMAGVAGQGDEMQLALTEDMSDQGEYTGNFIVAEEVTIDLNNIRQEQHLIGGERSVLRANKQYKQTVTLTPDSDSFTLENVPLIPEKPAVGNASRVETGDIRVTFPSGISLSTVNAETGEVGITGASGNIDADASIDITVTYYAGAQFPFTLDNKWVQGMTTTTVHTVGGTPDIADLVLVSGDTESTLTPATAPIYVVAPGPAPAHTLYKAVKFDPVKGDLTLAVRKNTPAEGAYIGVNYGAAVEVEIPKKLTTGDNFDTGTSQNATTTVTLSALRGIAEDAQASHFDVLFNAATVEDVEIISTGDDGEVTRAMLTLRTGTDDSAATEDKALSKGDKIYIVYDPDDNFDNNNAVRDSWSIPAPKGYNPQGSLLGNDCSTDDIGNVGDNCPMVMAEAGSTVTVTYEDRKPNVAVRETIRVDGASPIFDEASPSHGHTSSSEDVDISIDISDIGAGVDGKTIKLYMLASPDTITTGDFTFAPLSDDGDEIDSDDYDLDSGDGIYTISVNLEDLLRDYDDLDAGIERGKETYLWWIVKAADMAGNDGTSDAVADDKKKDKTLGSQPYQVRIDLKAPELLTGVNTRTGDWWDPDVTSGDEIGKLKNNKRDSIRVEFTEKLDGDSIDVGDFTVSVGEDDLNVLEALHYAPKHAGDIAKSVFLVVSQELDPDAAPKVTLKGPVADLAGRVVAQDSANVADGIAPGVTIEVSHEVSSGDALEISVITDEDITRGNPIVTFYIAKDDEPADGKQDTGDKGELLTIVSEDVEAGQGKRVGRTNKWVYSPTFEDGDSGKYGVMVTTATDRSGNQGTAGVKDLGDKAITFEIDRKLVFTGDAAKILSPNEDAKVSEREPFYITIDWASEDKEYIGDSQKAVTLTKAVLNEGEDSERNLLAEAITLDEGKSDERTLDGENRASTRNNVKFTITIPDVGIGKHTLTFNGMDSQGNALKADMTLKFEVVEQPKFELALNPGINLVSIPNHPADDDINAVLGEYEDINLVITRSEGVWLTATRDEDTGMFEATGTATDLTTIDAGHAYYIRTTAPVTVEVDIPAADIIREIPHISAKGGQWNLVPVISILPIGPNPGEIQAGDELDADDYFGSGLRIFTVADGRTVSVSQGEPDEQTGDNIKTGPVYTNDGKPETGAEFGMGYWVFYEFDTEILPGG